MYECHVGPVTDHSGDVDTILSTNLAANLIAADARRSSCPRGSAATAKVGWVATNVVTSVSFPIAEPGAGRVYVR